MKSYLEELILLPIPTVHDALFDFLDVPAKRACLRTCVALRNFVLERKAKLEALESEHDWIHSTKHVSLQLRWPGHQFSKCEVEGTLLVNNENSDIYLITWDKVSIFKSFRHCKTLNFALIPPHMRDQYELEMSWINGNYLYIFRDRFNREEEPRHTLRKKYVHTLKCINLNSLVVVSEKLLSFCQERNVWCVVCKEPNWENPTPVQFIENSQDPVSAIRKLVSLAQKYFIGKGCKCFLSNTEVFFTCNYKGVMNARTIEEDLLVWSAECPDLYSGHLTESHVVVITFSREIIIRKLSDGSHLRTVVLSQACQHDPNSTCCQTYSQLNTIINGEKIFIWVKSGYLAESHMWHVVDLESGEALVHKVTCCPQPCLVGLKKNSVIVSGSDDDHRRVLVVYAMNNDVSKGHDPVRHINYLNFTQCKDSRVAAISKDGFVLVHDDCKRMFFVVVNKSMSMIKKIIEYYSQ